jgi:hypothetical protein
MHYALHPKSIRYNGKMRLQGYNADYQILKQSFTGYLPVTKHKQ